MFADCTSASITLSQVGALEVSFNLLEKYTGGVYVRMPTGDVSVSMSAVERNDCYNMA